jgi:TonB-dependent receptor
MVTETNLSEWKRSKLAMLTSSALLALSLSSVGAVAHAQDEDETDAEESTDVIQVRGIRASLLNARATKRDADTFVDSISATDVSQLPDLSVAEALARVPGVVTQRFELGGSDGDFPTPEGSGNIVRGLRYVSSEFNGRETFTASQGRALEWATIPPELIGAVDVFKSQSADMLEGGIAGTVNLRTLEPFDRDGRVAVVVLDGTYTDLAEEFSPGGSVVLGDRWETDSGEFGVLASFSTSELNSAIQGFQYGPLLALNNILGDGLTYALPGGFQARDVEFERQRDSYYLAGQWRSPDDSMELTGKYIRAENETASLEHTFEFFTDAESWANWEVLPGDLSIREFTSDGIPQCNGAGEAANGGVGICETLIPVDGGLFESGVVSNGLRDWLGADGSLGTPFQTLGVYDQKSSITEDFSLNFKWRATDRLFVELDGQYVKSESSREMLWAGGNVFADYSFDFSDIENPAVNLFLDDSMQVQEWAVRGGNSTNPTTLSDPATSYLLYAADEFQDNDGEMITFRADATYEFESDSWFESVKFGVRRAERDQNIRQAGLNWGAIAAPWAGGYVPYANLDDQSAGEAFDFSGFQRGGVFFGDSTSVVFPSNNLLTNYDAFVAMVQSEPLISGSFTPDWNPLRVDGVVDYGRNANGSNASNFAGANTIAEDTTNAYVRFDFLNDFDNGQTIQGNIGVRYIKTDVNSTGTFVFAPIFDPVAQGFVPELTAYMSSGSVTNTVERDYSFVLPSFNMKWNLDDQRLIRLGISKSIFRPNMSTLAAGGSANAPLSFVSDSTTTPPSITNVVSQGSIITYGGNPYVDPIEAVNFDLSYENYFGEDGQFTVSYFYKDLENIIIYGEQNTGVVNLDGVDIGLDSRIEFNRNDGTVEGFEVAYTHFFTGAPGILANTGIQANYTYITSTGEAPEVVQTDDDDVLVEAFLTQYRWGLDELLGLSEQNYNIIGLYQTDKLEARVAYNWRSEYLSSYRDFVTGNPIIQDDIGYLDASIKYDFTENFQLGISGANLLDTKSVALQQVDQSGQTFGRSVFLGDRRFEITARYAF